MATDSEVMKSFLIELGFKIDETGAKKFRTGLSDTTKGALALGTAVIGVGLAIEKFVENLTEDLSKLYYAAQISGATVSGLKATAAGFEAIGLSADSAKEAIAAVGDRLRSITGKQFLSNMYGINVNQSTDKVTDELMHVFAAMFNQGPGVQRQRAISGAKRELHMDERQLAILAENIGEMDKRQGEYNQRLKEGGVNLEDNAKSAAEFQRELALISADFSVLANEVFPTLMKGIKPLVGDFEEFLHTIIKLNAEMPEQTGFWTKFWQGITGQAVTDVPEGTQGLTKEELQERSADPELFDAKRKRRLGQNTASTSSSAPVYDKHGILQVQAKDFPSISSDEQSQRDYEALKVMREELRVATNPQLIASLGREIARMSNARLGTGGTGAGATAGGGQGGGKTFAPNVNQTFNIHGDGANAVGESVKSVVLRTNDDLLRNGLGILAN